MRLPGRRRRSARVVLAVGVAFLGVTVLGMTAIGGKGCLAAQPAPRRDVPSRPEAASSRPPALLTHVPSAAGGSRGIAVRVLLPPRPRYPEGAPVAIHVAGGFGPGSAAGRPELVGLGFVEIFFAFPGGGRGEASSGGTPDFRGPASTRALADVILFATGRKEDVRGRDIEELAGEIAVLERNSGLIGSSQGGNTCGLALALHGEEFPDLAFYASMESPYGEGAANTELGNRESGPNPAYDPATGKLDLSSLAWSSRHPPAMFRREGGPAAGLEGSLFFDLDGDGELSEGEDFPAHVIVCDLGRGPRAWYSPRLIEEAERRTLLPERRPAHLPTLPEAREFWRYRDATESLPEAVRRCPDLAVIVCAGERDHVQVAPDHPHILAQVEAFRRAGARFVRLNPDRAYVERLLEAAGRPPGELPGGPSSRPVDVDAQRVHDRTSLPGSLEPEGLPVRILVAAAVCELADRVEARDLSANLDRVLFPEAPWRVIAPAAPGGVPRGPGGAEREDRPAPRGRDPALRGGAPPGPPGRPYGSGLKELEVDASRVSGKIRSLLGTNRGPLWYPRETVSLRLRPPRRARRRRAVLKGTVSR